MKKNYLKIIYSLSSLVIPVVASAQFTLASSSFRDFIMEIIRYLNLVVPVMYAFTFVVFFWGLSKVILNATNPAQVQNGRNYMFWGVIALFCLVALNGIIDFIMVELEFDPLQGGVWGILLPGSP